MASLEMNIQQVNADISSIKDAIVNNGVEVTDGTPTSEYSEKIDDVYKAGNEDMLRAMWELLQCGGSKTSYTGTIGNTAWTKDTFKPIYDIKLSGGEGYQLTHNCPPSKYFSMLVGNQVDIKQLEQEQGIVFDFSGITNADRMCTGGLFSAWNVVDISKVGNVNYSFYGGYFPASLREALAPKRIERLICGETNKFQTSSFQYAVGFEYIGFEGVIAQNGLNLQWSTKLSKESIVALINTLSPTTEGLTITISQTAKQNAFTDEEWATLIATKSNWTIALA